MNNQKNIPELRFSEFTEEWESKKLGEVAEFLDGKRKPIKESDRAKIKGKYPYYGASGIIDYINDFIFDEDIILLGEDGENIISRNLPLAFRVTGKCWINNHAHVIKPSHNTDISFLTYCLERISYLQYNTGTAQPKLNQEVCKGITIEFPSLPEQTKIATFLTAIDEKLQALKKKKALLEQYKKGVMQAIFSQQLRFKDDNGGDYPAWERKKLGEISEIKKGEQLNVTELTEIGLYPALNGGINPSGYTSNWNTEANTISISEGGNSCGYVNFNIDRFWSGGHCYSLINIDSTINV